MKILLLNGANPKYGRDHKGRNTFHYMALDSTNFDWSKQLAAMGKKVCCPSLLFMFRDEIHLLFFYKN